MTERVKKILVGAHLDPTSELYHKLESADNKSEAIIAALKTAYADGMDPTKETQSITAQKKQLDLELMKQHVFINKIKIAHGTQKIHTEYLKQQVLTQRLDDGAKNMKQDTFKDKLMSGMIEPIAIIPTKDKFAYVRIYESYINCSCRTTHEHSYYPYNKTDRASIATAIRSLSEHMNTTYHNGEMTPTDEFNFSEILAGNPEATKELEKLV